VPWKGQDMRMCDDTVPRHYQLHHLCTSAKGWMRPGTCTWDKLFFIGMCHCVQVGRVRSSASRDGAWEQNQHCQDEAEDMEAGCSCSVVGQIWTRVFRLPT
jgi:hypothetical protein